MPAHSRVRASTLVWAALLAAHATVARAQGAANAAITLADALRMAEAHAPRLKARESEVRGAEDALHLGQAKMLPSLDLGAQAARATDNNITGLMLPQSTIFPITGPVLATTSGRTVYGSAYGAVLSWTPFTFGQRPAEIRQAREELALARENSAGELFDLRARVAAAFLDLLSARELVVVQEQSVARAEASSVSVRALAASGLRPGVDSLLAIADASKARIERSLARRAATDAGARLTELLGTSGDAPPLARGVFLDSLPESNANRAAPDLASHPHVQPYVARVAISDARETATTRQAVPRLNVIGGLFARGSGIAPDGSLQSDFSSALSGFRRNSAIGLTLSMPVVDALLTGSRAGVAQARVDADRAELVAQEDRLRTQRSAAAANLVVAFETVRESPVQLAAASAAYEQMSARYSAGLATLAELAQAQYALTRAQADNVIAHIGAWAAWLDACAAAGDLAPFLVYVR
jgi:outer membrane protein